MEWSYGKNRMASVLERLIENKPKKKWYHYYCCFKKKERDENRSYNEK
jgi:hypothetical protein